jgi:predicted small metal-binding protein
MTNQHQEGPMTSDSLRVRCACGWEATGNEEELIRATEEHGRRVHNMLPTREEILAMIVTADTPASREE